MIDGDGVRWKCMLWNGTVFDICVDTLWENMAICSCMYSRNVSLDHRPIFLIVSWGTLFRCMAIAPPGRKLCKLASFGVSPLVWSPIVTTANYIAVLMFAALSMRSFRWACG